MVVLYTIMYVCIIMHTLEHTYTYTPNRHVEYTHLKYIHIFNNAEENTFSEKKRHASDLTNLNRAHRFQN